MRAAAIGLVCGLAFGVFASTAEAADVTCPQEYGVFAHPRDGKKYVECQKGRPTEHACSPGMLWDDLRKAVRRQGGAPQAAEEAEGEGRSASEWRHVAGRRGSVAPGSFLPRTFYFT
jgi:hypothetical protein